MDKNENQNTCVRNERQVPSAPVKCSFKETVKAVEARIEWDCLPYGRQARARELAMIIAEVERMAPDALIRVDGIDKEASEVAEIYGMLTHDHINTVLDNLGDVRYRISAMKTYLRTALYNVVFTMENTTDNMANAER